MGSRHRHQARPKLWSIEPKAPSQVSLSVRDQNVLRPPRRSASLKTAASNLKKGFSASNLAATAQDNLQTLRRGKFSSCSSLQVKKTRHMHAIPALATIRDDAASVVHSASSHSTAPYNCCATVGPPDLEAGNIASKALRAHQIVEINDRDKSPSKCSLTTVVHTTLPSAESSRPPSSFSQTASYVQRRRDSARRTFSKLINMSSKPRKQIDLSPAILSDQVDRWIEETAPAEDVQVLRNASIKPVTIAIEGDGYPPDQLLSEPDCRLVTGPISCMSPQSLRSNSFSASSETNPGRSQSCTRPLHLELAVQPEMNEASFLSMESLWAVVQIQALAHEADHLLGEPHGLDHPAASTRASYSQIGTISDVNISIRQRGDAVIESIKGDCAYAGLLLGQTITIAVCVKLRSLADDQSLGGAMDHRPSSRMSMMDAITELELSLGNQLSELFEVRLSYNHSFFPRSTRLEIRESCWLPRVMPKHDAAYRRNAIYAETIHNIYSARVQKQVAVCIASADHPRDALGHLEEYQSRHLSEDVVKYIDALRRRLMHRLTFSADLTSVDYLLEREYHLQSSQRHDHEKEVPDGHSQTSSDDDGDPDTSATIIRRKTRPMVSSVEPDEDEARRIWQHIRRTSRPGKPPVNDADVPPLNGTHEHESHLEEIRVAALKHGRKISSATLRSLAREMKRIDSSFIEEEEELSEDYRD